MADRQAKTEPSWRPLAKLSGLINRRSSTKAAKNTPEPLDEKNSVFRFKRQKKGAAESTLDFKPLEVQLDGLRELRLSDGWLETDAPKASKEQRLQAHKAEGSSSTPIADFFASKSVLDIPSSNAVLPLQAHPQSNDHQNTKRPFSMLETSSAAYTRALTEVAPPGTAVQTPGSILDRGRPVEPRQPEVGDPPKTTLLRSLPPESNPNASQRTATTEIRSLRPSQLGASNPAIREPPASSRLRPVEPPNTSKRHSMYEGVAAAMNAAASKTLTTPAPAPRSSSATPMDRIQAWQKQVTSASSSTPSFAPRSASPAGSSHGSSATPLVRRVSTRNTGDRLAWIRELEEKKPSSVNRDMGVLKKTVGSVSDKLAMFETKNALSAPTPRGPPLTRSNSTSRYSAGGLESIFSANSNMTTASPRTSIETTRSNHRASSVMSYYDDSFREKMETLVSGYDKDKDKEKEKDKPEIPDKQRVSAQFVSVDPKKTSEPVAEPKDLPAPVSAPAAEPEKPVVPAAEPEKEAELEKAAEPAKPEEPTAEPEVVVTPEVVAAPEAVTEPETVAEPEVAVEAEEVAAAETMATPEVAAEPEVVAEPEVSAEPEVVAEPEAVTEPEVTAITAPELVVEPELPEVPEVAVEPEVISEPEVVAEPEVVVEPEVVATPEVEPETVAVPAVALEVIPEPEMVAAPVAPEPEVAAEPEMAQTEIAAEPEVAVEVEMAAEVEAAAESETAVEPEAAT